MLSFQILDGGEVLNFALGERSVLIGAAADCDIRLRSEGVDPHHARVEPVRREGQVLYKIVDLRTEDGTRVNGDLVAQVALAVGDRVEIGAATLVLGKRVLRRATADDVLAAVVRPRPGSRRARARTEPRRTWLPWALGAVAVLAVVAGLVLRSSGPPASLVRLPELLRAGDYESATQIVDSVRRDWVRGDPGREQAIAGYVADLGRQKELVASLEAEVTAGASSLSVGDQIDSLKARQERAADDVERAAIRRVLARLHDLRLAAATSTPRAGNEPEASHSLADTAPTPSGESATHERAEAAVTSGDLHADSQQRDELAAVAPQRVESPELDAKVEDLLAGYRRQAEELVALGRGPDAADLLRRVSADFPAAARARLEQDAQAFAKVVPPAPPAPAEPDRLADPLGDLLRAVEAAESAWSEGDVAVAQQRFAEAAKQVGSRDAAYAAELTARSEDCRSVLELHDAVAKSLRVAGKPELVLAGDRKARLIDRDGSRLRFAGDEGDFVVSWLDLPADAVDVILRRLEVPAAAYVGAAVLAMAGGEEALAEQRLVTAMRKDADAKAAVDGLVARMRGERVPDGGYKLESGKLAAPALSPLVRELDAKLGSALARSDRKVRESVLSEVLARGPEQLDAVIQVLRRQQRGLVDKLAKNGFKGNWERLAAERDRLDRARAAALDLIFDEVKYFYPYAPPAVSGDRAREYFAVQREVDARVAAVKEIWDGSSLRFTIPDSIAADLERLRWVSDVLDGFGERSAGLLARARWVLTLPAQRTLDIKSFCRDAKEVESQHLATRIGKLNAKRALSLSAAERDELDLTNAYRTMMGRMPLALDLRVLAAARAHCEEMERLGYFGHISPDPARATPYDRMRLAGYGHGGSENIASNDSSLGAHTAWLHSSGHHRNILGIAHTEFACGQRGRLWTQNFGAGRDFEQELPD
ncbi:MAG: FHA domain-containing protein [Planctomycetota bacterium]